MSNILREYNKDGYHVIEYTKDGATASAIAHVLINEFVPDSTPIEPQPTVEEMQAQTLLNTEYLVSRSELGLGGN
ncbi:hypothetical protein FCT18_14825 [Lysinibacillus sphaericus]|uniref:Uncharacterized protein n=1 Tax=Lysinibacillus sphaericus TaxID=1421 RepID=A0A2S0K632_LYSSH|nr:hypothetical protein [Lysinibacillus sphaericus]AVK98830.1 hypothetical protein LS41612_22340 [Lysinibacillus sphaericus]MED4545309.1 hypothetical protein [Lysinibacillus sphaericus]TKI18368.1 hypothetical protein FCT18_14825 [Lysinibacillus sphaericus]SUV15154.1 Uncharacterised protein [Lysinibacillus sphaericus]